MRYVTFSTATESRPRAGLLLADRVLDVSASPPGTSHDPAPESILDIIRSGPDMWNRLARLGQLHSTTNSPAGIHRRCANELWTCLRGMAKPAETTLKKWSIVE